MVNVGWGGLDHRSGQVVASGSEAFLRQSGISLDGRERQDGPVAR